MPILPVPLIELNLLSLFPPTIAQPPSLPPCFRKAKRNSRYSHFCIEPPAIRAAVIPTPSSRAKRGIGCPGVGLRHCPIEAQVSPCRIQRPNQRGPLCPRPSLDLLLARDSGTNILRHFVVDEHRTAVLRGEA